MHNTCLILYQEHQKAEYVHRKPAVKMRKEEKGEFAGDISTGEGVQVPPPAPIFQAYYELNSVKEVQFRLMCARAKI
jgi:hypothetical protein